MAITSAVCNSFKQELLGGIHDLDTDVINLALGTNNVEYKIYCRITDSSGSIAERTIKLRIKEQ